MTGSRGFGPAPNPYASLWRRSTATTSPMLIYFDPTRDSLNLSAPSSRSFVLAALRALHLDTGVGSALSISRSKQLKNSLTAPHPFRDDYSSCVLCGLEYGLGRILLCGHLCRSKVSDRIGKVVTEIGLGIHDMEWSRKLLRNRSRPPGRSNRRVCPVDAHNNRAYCSRHLHAPVHHSSITHYYRLDREATYPLSLRDGVGQRPTGVNRITVERSPAALCHRGGDLGRGIRRGLCPALDPR